MDRLHWESAQVRFRLIWTLLRQANAGKRRRTTLDKRGARLQWQDDPGEAQLAKIADGLNCEVRYVPVPRISLVDQVMVGAMEHSKASVPMGGHSPLDIDGQSLVVLASLLSRIDKQAYW